MTLYLHGLYCITLHDYYFQVIEKDFACVTYNPDICLVGLKKSEEI
jgi:hypothetical protein